MQDNPYSKSLEARILSATPLELVVILYDEAIQAVRTARVHLAAGEIHARSRAVSKALSILIELTRSLNFEAGGDLSRRLAGVYGFMRKSLTEANASQTDEGLASTENLLTSLREAWATVSVEPEPGPVMPVPPPRRSAPDFVAQFPWGLAHEAHPLARSWSA